MGIQAKLRSYRLNQRSPRFYVDMALILPLTVAILQIIYSVDSWPAATWNLRDMALGIAGLLACLILSKETVFTLGVALAYIFVLGLVGLPMRAYSLSRSELFIACAGLIAAGIGAVLLAFWRAKGPPLYQSSRPVVDRLVVGFAIILALAFFFRPLRTAFNYYLLR